MPGREVTGGAAYDALVAAIAAEHGCELITCDRRAAPIYERYALRISLL
jgi:predicted nucleic acid-binding protein